MKISTKGRYGLRTLLDIALHHGDGVVTLNEIAQRQGISVKYLWQVINPLKRAGLLRVTRGAKGGYALARDPAEVTLYDIIIILEGDISLVNCLSPSPGVCGMRDSCVAHSVWGEINQGIADILKGLTLAEIMERCEKTCNFPAYVI